MSSNAKINTPTVNASAGVGGTTGSKIASAAKGMTGVIVFTFMSHFMFKEPLTIKTITCLILSILVVLIQLFWK
jgi:hypothetical protein